MAIDRMRLSRRGAMLLPLAAAGCKTLDEWFGDKKTPLTGTREAISNAQRGLKVDNPPGRAVTLPQAAANTTWPQSGADPTHVPGNPALGQALDTVWTASIGAPGGYRRRITATPVIGGGRVFAMDSNAVVSAYDQRSGAQLWRTETMLPDDDSTNVGGGVALDGDTLYAATGLAALLALDVTNGKPRWRQTLPAPARAAPTIVEDRLYLPTLDEQLLALARADGARLWAYQSTATMTSVLGLPSPAFTDGLLVAGFGSGDLVCLRAVSGSVSWSDGLTSARGRSSLLDFSAIPGLPAIADGRVYAIGLGGLLVSIDLRTGRRLWEREVSSAQSLWLAGDWLFVLTPDQMLGAVNAGDGQVAWATQLPLFQDEKAKEDPITWVGPVLAGGRLLVAGSNHDLREVNPQTGALLPAPHTLPGVVTVAPVVADNTLYLVTEDAKLLALR